MSIYCSSIILYIQPHHSQTCLFNSSVNVCKVSQRESSANQVHDLQKK